MIANATAMSIPMSGPTRYTHKWAKSVETTSGANERTGFIDAPLIGLAHSPASAMYPATPRAENVPTFWAPDAVPRMVVTSPQVRATSMRNAWASVTWGPGMVAPRRPMVPKIERRKRQPSSPPAVWATTYRGTRTHGNSRRKAKATLTTGFRCAPETAPIARITAMTMSAGATTADTRPTEPREAASTTGAPAATNTRKKVPTTSANRRRHSYRRSKKSRAQGGVGGPTSSLAFAGLVWISTVVAGSGAATVPNPAGFPPVTPKR